MDELISIIVPIYNAEKYIEKLLEDIVNQTYKNIEIILVNDGSSDSSYDIMQRFAKDDARIQIINIENGGASKARNIGLNIAKGKYIRFFDADDRVPKLSVERMVEVYKEHDDIDIVMGNYKSIPEKNLITGERIINGKICSDDFVDTFIENIRSFYFGVPWNKLYKRELIEKYHIRFNESIIWCEDFLFNIEYFDKCKWFYFLYMEEGVYEYILHDSSITHIIKKQEDKTMLKDIEKVRYEKAREYCAKNGKECIFEIEWNCSNVYSELSELAKGCSMMNISSRYFEFVAVLKKSQVYEYINMKSKHTNLHMWKILEFLIRKHQYKSIFLIFLVKGFMVTNMKMITGVIKKKINHYIPPNL